MDRQISLLIPSRGRPERLIQMIASAWGTSDKTLQPLQFCIGLDEDDPAYEIYTKKITEARLSLNIAYHISTKRMSAPEHLNRMATTIASGDLMFALGDDVIFRTPGWNLALNQLWNMHPDNILIAYFNNGMNREKCEHFVFHSDWIRLTENICPLYFRHFCVDAWVEDIAKQLGRLVYINYYIVEHMHFKYGKAVNDETYQEIRRPVWNSNEPNSKESTSISEIDTMKFNKTKFQRSKIADKLREYIKQFNETRT